MSQRIQTIMLWFAMLFSMGCTSTDWHTASRESAGLAPKPEELKESIFQIYTARAFSWRGHFAIHPWISWKQKDEVAYTVAQVTAWGNRQDSTIYSRTDIPDRQWFGSVPQIIFEARGEKADKIIAQLQPLLANYPYKDRYRLWPGPNSNTFVDYIIRNIPEITVELPPSAIGKDYLTGHYYFVDRSPTGTGFQVSIFGLLGFTLGLADGVEVNLLGLTFGVDILSPALKLPFIGRLGMKDREF